MKRYVMIDLEMCVVPKSHRTKEYRWSQEMIQIGAVLLDTDLEITDRFMTYVSPEYGFVTPFITNLTGISPKDTESAPCAGEALRRLAEWMPADAVPVAWSENDEIQIRRELMAKNLEIPSLTPFMDRWIDCQKEFGEKMNTLKKYRLSEALLITGICYAEGIHDALVDASNTAMLFAKMKREPQLQLSPYYRNGEDTEEFGYRPFADLFANACAM